MGWRLCLFIVRGSNGSNGSNETAPLRSYYSALLSLRNDIELSPALWACSYQTLNFSWVGPPHSTPPGRISRWIFATEEQAAKMKGQMIILMHWWLHIESHEICRVRKRRIVSRERLGWERVTVSKSCVPKSAYEFVQTVRVGTRCTDFLQESCYRFPVQDLNQ